MSIDDSNHTILLSRFNKPDAIVAPAKRLMILTIGGNVKGRELRCLASVAGDLGKTLELASTSILNRAKKRTQRMGIAEVEQRCEWGDSTETIINAVKREKSDCPPSRQSTRHVFIALPPRHGCA